MKTILFQIIILFSFVGVSYSSDVFYDPFKEWKAIEYWLRHGNQFGLSYFIVRSGIDISGTLNGLSASGAFLITNGATTESLHNQYFDGAKILR